MKWFTFIRRAAGSSRQSASRRRGVDAGRAAFVRVDDKGSRQKKNLLKKLNFSWGQKKTAARSVYIDPPPKSGWKRKAVLLACLAVVSVVFVKADGVKNGREFLENLDYFRITAIVVEGCVNASPQKVRDAAGVSISTSQFSIDIDEVADRILEENSWVESVDVSRYWPAKLVVTVSEYQPHALITVESGEEPVLHYLDRSGEPFIEAGKGMDLDFPVITGLESERDEGQLSEKLEQPLYFLRLAGANNPNLPAQSVSEIHVDEKEGLVVYLVEYPFPIFLGSDDIRQKYVRLRKILEVLYKQRKTGMDIGRVAYIRMDYLKDKAIVGYSESG